MAAKEVKMDRWIFGEGEAGQGPEKNNGPGIGSFRIAVLAPTATHRPRMCRS